MKQLKANHCESCEWFRAAPDPPHFEVGTCYHNAPTVTVQGITRRATVAGHSRCAQYAHRIFEHRAYFEGEQRERLVQAAEAAHHYYAVAMRAKHSTDALARAGELYRHFLWRLEHYLCLEYDCRPEE